MKSLILLAAFVGAVFALPRVGEAGGHCLNGQCNVARVVVAPRQQVVVQRQAVVVQRAVVAPRVNVNVGRGFFGRQRVNVNVR